MDIARQREKLEKMITKEEQYLKVLGQEFNAWNHLLDDYRQKLIQAKKLVYFFKWFLLGTNSVEVVSKADCVSSEVCRFWSKK